MTIRVQILELLRKLMAEARLPIVMISHDLHAICGEAMVMLQGVVVERGPPSSVFTSPQADYAKKLVAATPSLGAYEPGKPPAHLLTDRLTQGRKWREIA